MSSPQPQASERADAEHKPAEPSTSENEQQPSLKDVVDSSECPFCVMMRKGGCEAEFIAFMECGEKAEEGENKFKDCVQYFDGLQASIRQFSAATKCMSLDVAIWTALYLNAL